MPGFQVLLYIWSEDGLRLPGVHYATSPLRDTCVIVVPGMGGLILEYYFAHVLGEMLSENGVGCIFGHNRGYSYINDISTKEISEDGGYKTVQVGITYERFKESVYDIDAWLANSRSLGYKRFVLLGHSLGCF